MNRTANEVRAELLPRVNENTAEIQSLNQSVRELTDVVNQAVDQIHQVQAYLEQFTDEHGGDDDGGGE